MKIIKFKKVGTNKYKVLFESEELTLYEDVILKYDLLIKKDIDLETLDKIIEENNNYDAYNLALNYIEIKMRNKSEIITYLKKKEFNNNIIYEVIEKLETLGLLNEKKYIEAYINDRILLSYDGPYKIRKKLIDFEFKETDIDLFLNKIDDNIWKEKIDKLIKKKSSLMKTKSYYMFIEKIKNDLYNDGYDKDMIEEKLSNIVYESDALEKDYNKAIKKYNDKTKVINYLLRKGYNYDEIKTLTN